MLLDYPYYEELCRLKHRAAYWWLIGDRLYYLGLLPAILAISGGPIALAAWLLGLGPQWLTAAGVAAVTLPAGAVLLVVGSTLKRHAYTLAERDGIWAAEVYARTSIPRAADAETDSDPERDGS